MNKTAPESDPVYDGFTRPQLEVAFRLVRDPKNWKNPIDVTLAATPDDLKVIQAAIAFYTGSLADCQQLPHGERGLRGQKRRYRITAAGYYLTIGA